MPKIRYTYLYICIFILICIGLSISWSAKEGFTNYTLPRTIWSYWHDPNIPSSLRKILSERQAVLSTWEHRVLNEVTVYDYIAREEFPHKYNDLGHQHKADWIRLYLLKRYGGCWMDASILVNSPKDLEALYSESIATKAEFTGFYFSTQLLNGQNESYIENWFMLAPLHSPLISLWLDEYTEAIDIGFLTYKKRVTSVIDISNIYGTGEDNENNVYLTQHACLQYILRHKLTRKPTLVLKDAADTMFKPLVQCKWNSDCVIEYLNNTPIEEQPSYIKLRSQERSALE